MTPIASMVLEMIRKGVDPEVIALAVSTAETVTNSTGIPPDSAAEKRRAYDRARKRKSTGIPPDSTGIPNSPSLYKKESKEEGKKERARGSRLPEDWRLDQVDFDYALSKDIPKTKIPSIAEGFANHHWAKGTVFLNWRAAWRKWIGNEIKFNGNKNGKIQHDNPKAGSLIGALDRAIQQSIAEDAALAAPTDIILSLPSRSIQRS
jgi:Ni/Co efflux regulator RcnB